ncbi:Uncharacterised protein [Citrobacter koseri]|uniref:Uncharacterized protein n=1 Tax=Citrobacter koseri TaxID=545 RepID=A0A2X2WWV3_CITKO|nr:Uncharacterised protein [Citrobacter koseri]
MFDGFRGVIFYGLPVGLQSFRVLLYVLRVVKVFIKQNVAKGVNQRHIATVVQLQVLIGNTGGLNAPGIAHNNFGAVLPGLNDSARDNRGESLRSYSRKSAGIWSSLYH